MICIHTKTIIAQRVALFASSGCYSHDVMMREVGKEFPGANVSWVQVYMYEFGFGPVKLPSTWTSLLLHRIDEEGHRAMHYGHTLVWKSYMPVNWHRPSDIRSIIFFLHVLRRTHPFCAEVLHSEQFAAMMRQKFDIVIVDHLLQECFTALASLLNATTIQFSNWPIADAYITSLNVPANPSSTAKTSSPYSCLKMSFFERVANSIFHFFLVMTRIVHMITIESFFEEHGYPKMDLNRIESAHLFYAGRSELLFDNIRPINNRIKFFGCSNCRPKSEYRIARITEQLEIQNAHGKNIFRGDASLRSPIFNRSSLKDGLSSGMCITSCNISAISSTNYFAYSRHTPTKNSTVPLSSDDLNAMRRFQQVQKEFPAIDFNWLEENKFIVISFGSLVQAEFMPPKLLERFLQTLGTLNYTVIWHTNSFPSTVQNGTKLPSNVIAMQWVPLKILLAHRNLLYFVTHGGINTLNEILLFGIPILGCPLQGDQISNLQRATDLGIGAMTSLLKLYDDGLKSSLAYMEENLDRFSRRAAVISQMLQDHKKLTAHSQHFWLYWALRHGAKVKANSRRYFHFFYYPSFQYFAIPQLMFAFVVIAFLIYVLSL